MSLLRFFLPTLRNSLNSAISTCLFLQTTFSYCKSYVPFRSSRLPSLSSLFLSSSSFLWKMMILIKPFIFFFLNCYSYILKYSYNVLKRNNMEIKWITVSCIFSEIFRMSTLRCIFTIIFSWQIIKSNNKKKVHTSILRLITFNINFKLAFFSDLFAIFICKERHLLFQQKDELHD